MRRRDLLAKLGVSTAGLATVSGISGALPEDSDISEEEAKRMLEEAEKKDAKKLRVHDDQPGISTIDTTILVPFEMLTHVRRVLEKLEPETRAAVLKDRLAVTGEVTKQQSDYPGINREKSGEEVQKTDSEDWAKGTAYLYYDVPSEIGGGWVCKWVQEIEWGWNSDDELSFVDERYYSKITGGDPWKKQNQNVADETGGVGDSRYRLYTTATFANCFGVGPVQQCFNQRQLWVDMTVYPGGDSDIDTSG